MSDGCCRRNVMILRQTSVDPGHSLICGGPLHMNGRDVVGPTLVWHYPFGRSPTIFFYPVNLMGGEIYDVPTLWTAEMCAAN